MIILVILPPWNSILKSILKEYYYSTIIMMMTVYLIQLPIAIEGIGDDEEVLWWHCYGGLIDMFCMTTIILDLIPVILYWHSDTLWEGLVMTYCDTMTRYSDEVVETGMEGMKRGLMYDGYYYYDAVPRPSGLTDALRRNDYVLTIVERELVLPVSCDGRSDRQWYCQ